VLANFIACCDVTEQQAQSAMLCMAQVKGKAMIENGRIWSQIADLFDHHLMDAASVEQVHTAKSSCGFGGMTAV
jgi:hypothetical protein